MNKNNRKTLVESIRKFKKSKKATDLQERLLRITEQLDEASKGSDIDSVLKDLARTQRILDKDRKLQAFYGLQVNMLFEAAEFKKTGRRVIFD